jgi:hypothetical protein
MAACAATTETMSERFLTLSQVRAMLGVSRATLWRWTNERGLARTRLRRKLTLARFNRQNRENESVVSATFCGLR